MHIPGARVALKAERTAGGWGRRRDIRARHRDSRWIGRSITSWQCMLWSLQLALRVNYFQCNNSFLTGKKVTC